MAFLPQHRIDITSAVSAACLTNKYFSISAGLRMPSRLGPTDFGRAHRQANMAGLITRLEADSIHAFALRCWQVISHVEKARCTYRIGQKLQPKPVGQTRLASGRPRSRRSARSLSTSFFRGRDRAVKSSCAWSNGGNYEIPRLSAGPSVHVALIKELLQLARIHTSGSGKLGF